MSLVEGVDRYDDGQIDRLGLILFRNCVKEKGGPESESLVDRTTSFRLWRRKEPLALLAASRSSVVMADTETAAPGAAAAPPTAAAEEPPAASPPQPAAPAPVPAAAAPAPVNEEAEVAELKEMIKRPPNSPPRSKGKAKAKPSKPAKPMPEWNATPHRACPPALRGLKTDREPWAKDANAYQEGMSGHGAVASKRRQQAVRQPKPEEIERQYREGYENWMKEAGWNATPFRNAPWQIRGLQPVTREPWFEDMAICTRPLPEPPSSPLARSPPASNPPPAPLHTVTCPVARTCLAVRALALLWGRPHPTCGVRAPGWLLEASLTLARPPRLRQRQVPTRRRWLRRVRRWDVWGLGRGPGGARAGIDAAREELGRQHDAVRAIRAARAQARHQRAVGKGRGRLPPQ